MQGSIAGSANGRARCAGRVSSSPCTSTTRPRSLLLARGARATSDDRASYNVENAVISAELSAVSDLPSTSGQHGPTAASASSSRSLARRRSALLGLAATAASTLLLPTPPNAHARGASAADAKAVGSYLPPAPVSMGVPEGWVLYAPDARATPSTRAGVIKPPLYSWSLPPSFRPDMLVNALTGNFCFPNCVEPWYEASFSDPAVGKVFLCCIVLKKLVPSSRDDGGGATVETLGPAENVARAIGPLITGQGYEDEDLVSAKTRKTSDGQIFYDLELLASTADPAGPRRRAAVTVKGPIVYLFVSASTEKQARAGGDEILPQIVQSFRA